MAKALVGRRMAASSGVALAVSQREEVVYLVFIGLFVDFLKLPGWTG